MKTASKTAIVALVTLLTMSTSLTASAFEDKDVIDYRQNLMKALDSQTAALGMVVSTLITSENLIQHLDAIALTAKASMKSFEPKVQGGESLPVVWEKWDDFSKRMNDFITKTQALAETGRKQGQDAVVADMVAALSCKSCHDVYREKK